MTYRCSVCDKSYTTSSHLARHVIAHQPDRQFKCQFCLKTYVRQDIARHHAERCSKRQGQPLARPQGRGQPRKACKRCSNAKISCNGVDPCGSCLKAAVQCSYRRPRSELAILSENTAKCSTQQTQTPDNTALGTSSAGKIPFLLSYTAAEAGSPKGFTQALETLRNNFDGAAPETEVDAGDMPHHSFPIFTPFFAADACPLDIPQSSSGLFELFPHSTPSADAREDILRRRTADLVAFFREGTTSPSTHDVITDLLTPVNLSLSVENFFQCACKHVPIVHKPSFELASAELSLLVAIFVVGAVWSYPRDTYFMVLEVVELAENCVFEDPLYRKLQGCESKSVCPALPGVLPILQAATMLVSRFSDLISIIRSLKVENDSRSRPADGSGSTLFAWTDYIRQESCSRVIYYIYLLDCHISTLYTILPRIPVLEMQACLPSDDSAFGAEDAETCQSRLSSARSSPRLSLVDVIQSLMAVESMRPELFELTAFPLFLTVGALQAMIFTAKAQLLETPQSVRFKRALTRWKEIWDHSQDVQNSSKGTGFMVHADEFWLLAQKVLKSDTSKLILRFGVNDMAQVRRWLTELD